MEGRHNVFAYMPDRWCGWHPEKATNLSASYNQFDGLLFFPSQKACILFECKIRNTQEAIWQMLHYRRLLEVLLPSWTIRSTEVCKYYDPVVRAPDGSEPHFIPQPELALAYPEEGKHFVFLYGG